MKVFFSEDPNQASPLQLVVRTEPPSGERGRYGRILVCPWRKHQTFTSKHSRYLEGMEIICQTDGSCTEPYGFDVRYRPFVVCLYDAERMVKTLRWIQNRLARVNRAFGAPTSFGQYVARIANVLGSDQIVFSPGTPTEAVFPPGESIIMFNALCADLLRACRNFEQERTA